jgi:hypothetical protein
MMVFPSKRHLLVLIASAAHTLATYYIDDTNATIQYRGTGWRQETPATSPWLATTEVFDHTM